MTSLLAADVAGLSSPRRPLAPRSAFLVILLCWFIVVFDGYDLIVYGTTLPLVMAEPGWHLDAATAGFMGSLAFAGMLVGALLAGDLADRLGRRRTILWATLWFSVFTALIFFAPNREMFGLLRFVSGVGLGGLVPSANALTAEFIRDKHRSAVSTIMMSGVPIGGSLAALLGLVLLPHPGWRYMYAAAFAAVVVLLPLCYAFLPESPTWLRAHGRLEDAERVEAQFGVEPSTAEVLHEIETAFEGEGEMETPHLVGLRAVLSRKWLLATILYAVATVATLFAWYGLGTWLPKLMGSDAHFHALMPNPLFFLLALNLGAVLGSVLTAWAGIVFGPIRSSVISALAAAIGLGYLITYPSHAWLVVGALVLAGVGTHGTQCLIIAAVASHYPARLRGTALGFALGMGRIGAVLAPLVGGWLLVGTHNNVASNFAAFGGAAALAALLLWVTSIATRPVSRKVVTGTIGH